MRLAGLQRYERLRENSSPGRKRGPRERSPCPCPKPETLKCYLAPSPGFAQSQRLLGSAGPAPDLSCTHIPLNTVPLAPEPRICFITMSSSGISMSWKLAVEGLLLVVPEPEVPVPALAVPWLAASLPICMDAGAEDPAADCP